MSEPTYSFGGTAAPAPGTGAGNDLIKDTTTRDFGRDVIEASRQQPVLVDFWAPWCGPCKQLTPLLEDAVRKAGGKVALVKLNIDEHPEIPGQMGIQSIPAVFAFKNGQPLDGFMGAQPESQIKAFIERVAGPIGPSQSDLLVEQADAARESGDFATAAQAYAAVLQQEAEHIGAIAGLAQCYIATDDVDRARDMLAMVPEAKQNDPAVLAANAALQLAEQAADLGDLADLQAKVEADPADHQSRFDLAVALNARDQREAAIDHLIDIVRRDRNWNEEGARKQLLQFFDAWGPTDEMTLYGRRQLSSILFS